MRLLLLTIIIVPNLLIGQVSITNKEIKGEWFTSNQDSAFFKCDTLIFYKRTTKQPYVAKRFHPSFIEPESELLGTSLKNCIKFLPAKKVHFISPCGYINGFWSDQMIWKIEKDTIIIKSNKFKWSFKVIIKEKQEFKYLVSNQPDEYITLSTPKWTLVRINKN